MDEIFVAHLYEAKDLKSPSMQQAGLGSGSSLYDLVQGRKTAEEGGVVDKRKTFQNLCLATVLM